MFKKVLSPLVATLTVSFSSLALAQNFNDPLYKKQKYLQQIRFEQALPYIRSLGAAEVRIGIIDSGAINDDHPELRGRIASGSDSSRITQDRIEHGHSLVGVLAGIPNNAFGGVGILGDKIAVHYRNVTTKVRADMVRTVQYSFLAQTIRSLANMSVDAINISMAYPSRCTQGQRQESCDWPIVTQPAVAAAVEYALNLGVPVIIAAGNTAMNLRHHPLQEKGLVVVGAGSGSRPSSFSNRGNGVDVYAPGDGILYLTEDKASLRGSGTSYAAPLVSGTIGLMRAHRRLRGLGNTPLELKNMLLQTSQGGTSHKHLDMAAALARALQ